MHIAAGVARRVTKHQRGAADVIRGREKTMVGLMADMGSVNFPDLLSIMSSSLGLSGPVGLSGSGNGDSVGLGAGVGLDFYAGSGFSVGLNDGVGLFA